MFHSRLFTGLSSFNNRAVFVALLMQICLLPMGAEAGSTPAFTAREHERRTIYHSPQTPGFTSWVGAWIMPDQSVMNAFTQATGPVEGRPQAPLEIQQRLNWPPPGHPGYDMTGLDLRNVHLRSWDSGRTWKLVSADPFKSNMNGITGEPEVALPDGTVLRGVWGQYLPYNPEVPQTGYLQRSTDGTLTWGPPEILLDQVKYQTFPKRIRVLRDGRVILVGGVAPAPGPGVGREEAMRKLEPLLLVSSDQGRTWSPPIAVVPQSHRRTWGGEEYDVAELPNGDLLCVFRRPDPAKQKGEVRWQGVLRKTGDTWTPTEVGPAPFPHSGHPELLATREGPILHLATSGVHWTIDAGRTWHRLDIPGTGYYPRSVQTADGLILVFAHVGGDDAYGKSDQSIVMDSFRIAQP
ncbi:MAG: exo-alpha-sialidase [Opitutaceae bacterium]|nr:exo-alpha-sialidase [Opitutaceae bacterium]